MVKLNEITKVTDNIFFMTNSPYNTNTGIVIKNNVALLIDPGITYDDFGKLNQFLNNKKIYSFTTHFHYDHLLNHSNLNIINRYASTKTVELIKSNEAKILKEIKDENIKIDESLLFKEEGIDLGYNYIPKVENNLSSDHIKIELSLIEGHEKGQTFVYIDEFKTLFCADTISSIEVPTANSKLGFKEYLNDLKKLEKYVIRSKIVIPGHGPIHTYRKAMSLINEDRLYITSLLNYHHDYFIKHPDKISISREILIDTTNYIEEGMKILNSINFKDNRITQESSDFHKNNLIALLND